VAAVHLAHRDGRFEVCWQLAWLLQPYFLVRAKLDDWRAVCELALRAARADGNRQGEAAILSSLGVANGVARAFKEAIRYLREVLEIQLELGEREGAARALYNLSLAAYSDSDFDIALEWGSEALRIVRELNLGNFEADALQNLGSICVSRGEFVQALDFVDSALAIWEHNGTSEAARFAYETRGRALIGLGRAEEGIRSEERAVEMHFARSELYEAATVLTQLGTNHLRLGSPHLAREHWLRAVRLLTEISHPYAGEVRAKLAALVAGQA
jgi:tetratricopeptide (TPR) repeat protein